MKFGEHKMPIGSIIVIIAIVIAFGFCGAALAWAIQTDGR
jgi:multisubunit Na+/H+ antiporter MnhC subunit